MKIILQSERFDGHTLLFKAFAGVFAGLLGYTGGVHSG
ncbi:hypothetical protein ABIE20_000909 [Pseudomonas sp. 2835]